jgi:hypothetical protein
MGIGPRNVRYANRCAVIGNVVIGSVAYPYPLGFMYPGQGQHGSLPYFARVLSQRTAKFIFSIANKSTMC